MRAPDLTFTHSRCRGDAASRCFAQSCAAALAATAINAMARSAFFMAEILLPRRPPPRRLPCLPRPQQRAQRLGRILRSGGAELVVRVDAVAGGADAHFARLERQPVALADDGRT